MIMEKFKYNMILTKHRLMDYKVSRPKRVFNKHSFFNNLNEIQKELCLSKITEGDV